LAELSPREAAQLLKLLGRVKSRLTHMASAPVRELRARDKGLAASGFRTRPLARHAASAGELVLR
jgi:hypothetical protein